MSNSENNHPNTSPKFRVGRVVTTRGLSAALEREGFYLFVFTCLARHSRGDWGSVDSHDAALNDRSASDDEISAGARILSAYPVPAHLQGDGDPDDRIWIITNTEAWDAVTPMRATTILWPSDY